MLKPASILQFLFSLQTDIVERETTEFFELSAKCAFPLAHIEQVCIEHMSQLPGSDRLYFTVSENEVPFTLDSGNPTTSGPFYERWRSLHEGYEDEDQVEVTITIQKNLYDQNNLQIYNSAAFFSHLQTLSIVECLEIFSRLLSRTGYCIYFIASDLQEEFYTNTLCFIPTVSRKSEVAVSVIDHIKTWERLKSISYFSGVTPCVTLPEDFDVSEAGNMPVQMRRKFDQCCMLLCLSAIYDITTVQGNTLFLKLTGYKTFNKDLPLDTLSVSNLPLYYKIYKWVLTGGNLQDKIGLVRNLISINLNPADNFSLAQSVYDSILSGFKVYERQNIKQYIELRNKMSDQLTGFNEKAGKIVDSFASSFQKSALAVVSLYASIIVSRVLSSHNFVAVFTWDSTILSFAFIVISAIYFFINRWEINEQRKRFVASYNNMKSRNEDLLTKEDIIKILNNDLEFHADLAFIKGKQTRYSFMWIAMLVIFSVVTLWLYSQSQGK